LQGDFFVERKRGFDDKRDGIKKKPGLTRLFSTRKKVRGSGNEDRGGRRKRQSRPQRMGIQAVIAIGIGKDR
jgi:hypothetical protein